MDKNYREGFHEVGNTVEVANVPNVKCSTTFWIPPNKWFKPW